MAIGLTSARSDRRRRVLTEEMKAGNKHADTPSHLIHSQQVDEGPRYTSGASPENQSHVTDFVPQRLRSLTICVLLGAALVAGLLALSRYADVWASAIGAESVVVLKATGTGTLVAWFSSVLLGLAGLLSVLLYSLRKHRIDDYRGRYKVWLWAAAGWVVLSIDHVAPLHKLLVRGMTHVTGWTALPDGAVWWIAACALAFLLFGIRAIRDLAESPIALVAALLAIFGWSAAVATHLGWWQWATAETAVLVTAGAAMGGHLMLCTALAAYARHVILDAQGFLPVKPNRRRDTCDDNQSSHVGVGPTHKNSKPSARKRRTDLADEPLASKKLDRAKVTDWVDGSQQEDDLYDGESSGGRRKLSKSERKRLRKLKARQQR